MKPRAIPDKEPGPRTAATHVDGLDFILDGGIPAGRTTLVVGGPGCGKSILASEFVVRGAAEGEAGLLLSFDETPEQIAADLADLDLPLRELEEKGLVRVHFIDPVDVAVPTSGSFTLDGLFLQIQALLDGLGGARRVALDGLESFFSASPDRATARAEMRRLFHWLGDRDVTAVVTSERGSEPSLTRLGLEEYLTDCVILLEYTVEQRIATRRARVLKRRGGSHSGDEHPFLISDAGIRLFPIISSRLSHTAPAERVSTGIDGLDDILGGRGFYRGASVLVSGTPGAGKSSIAAAFVDAACGRGETAVYYSFEESSDQIVRNMGSVGYDLRPWVQDGLLHIRSNRPSEYGLEAHLMAMAGDLRRLDPDVVVLDPFTSLTVQGFHGTARSMMIRIVDLLKKNEVTAMLTSLGGVGTPTYAEDRGSVVSSLMDTWLVLEARWIRGRRKRLIWVLKSRGMQHATELHELEVTDDGLAVSKLDEDAPDPGNRHRG